MYAYVGNESINRIDPSGLSDLNLFDKTDPLHDSADEFDMEGVYTITGHGNRYGIEGPDGRLIKGASELLQRMKGYEFGQAIAIASCNVGNGDLPQDLANLTGSTVYAAKGYVYFPSTELGYKSGTPVASLDMFEGKEWSNRGNASSLQRFDSRDADGRRIRVSVNAETGMATVKHEAQAGSHIVRRAELCVDKSKCDSK